MRTLRAVAIQGSFKGAADELGVSQSAVSWKMKRLEERVGMKLVDRTGEMTLTDDGADLLHYAERMIAAHDGAVEHLSRSDLAGVLRLGTNEDHQGAQLSEVLARFGRVYPQVELQVRVGLSGQVGEWLDDGEVDVAVLQIPDGASRPDDHVLWRDQLIWVKGRDHLFPVDEVVPVISFGPGFSCHDDSERSFRQAGVHFATVLECPMLTGVQRAVEAGLGIAPIRRRSLTSAMAPWEHADRCLLPAVCEVIRCDAAGNPELIAAMTATLVDAVTEPTGLQAIA